MSQANVWMVADNFEARSKDKHHYGPLQRFIWKMAHEELLKVLGKRELPNG